MKEDSFLVYVLDQLRGIVGIDTKKMFGSVGLYVNGVFFGIVSSGVLYIKTNSVTRNYFIERGMKPFTPNEKQVLKHYYEVPEECIEDREELQGLVRESIEI
tara:strand:+ start:596 stop:901 length:306 start_codon:yes stop_codon:yes gene_type:complete